MKKIVKFNKFKKIVGRIRGKNIRGESEGESESASLPLIQGLPLFLLSTASHQYTIIFRRFSIICTISQNYFKDFQHTQSVKKIPTALRLISSSLNLCSLVAPHIVLWRFILITSSLRCLSSLTPHRIINHCITISHNSLVNKTYTSDVPLVSHCHKCLDSLTYCNFHIVLVTFILTPTISQFFEQFHKLHVQNLNLNKFRPSCKLLLYRNSQLTLFPLGNLAATTELFFWQVLDSYTF